MSGAQVAERSSRDQKISWRMHPWPLQAKHENVLSKRITSDRNVAKTSAFKAAEKAIKNSESKTKVEL